MDKITQYNQERWEELAQAGVYWSRPLLELNPETARQLVDPYGVMSDVQGKDVLCLASGGGQQSVAFALLGANVTVLDFSANQLDHDRTALAHYHLDARLEQGDMRDLSRFADQSFDMVWHAFSINFIPDPLRVFDEVARVLRPGGLYRLEWNNPFTHGLDERDAEQGGYTLRQPYRDGEVTFSNTKWDFDDAEGKIVEVEGPREFRHTLSTVLNGLIARRLQPLGLWEELSGDPEAEPGTWEHFKLLAPPWLTVWCQLGGGK
ncbi:MAG: class I SAM-dependent methyltransferase [Anaerolineae bacterium]|nr:class I SAM-dependent methyltransferase [Anaerolineae bacterium]